MSVNACTLYLSCCKRITIYGDGGWGGGSWGNLDKWRRIGLRMGGKKEKMRRNIGRDGKEYEKEMNHKKKRR